jgi:hypothetical protein
LGYFQQLKMGSIASHSVTLAAAVFAVACLDICRVRADEKKAGQPADLSVSNSPSLKPRQNGLKQLEQDLFKPFENIAPNGSLDGAFVPSLPEPRVTPPAIQSKRAKDLLERRRDWVFETPEEILAAPSSKEIANGRDKEKDGNDNSRLSPLERFYERLYKKDKRESSRQGKKRDDPYDSRKSAFNSDGSEADEDADLPLGVREAQREMQKLLTSKERKTDASADAYRNSFSDAFGLGKDTQARDEMEMQRERMGRYRELVGLPAAPTFENDPLKQFRDIVGTSPKNSGLFPTMDSLGGLPQNNLFGSQQGAATVSPNTSLLPEGAQIHTAPSLAPVLPKIEPPRSLPPPVTFGAPRRAF